MSEQDNSRSLAPLALLSDQPIGEGSLSTVDGLGFENYAQVLGDVAVQTPGPFTVGVLGEWGTGKTSLLRLVERHLTSRENIIAIWFNAWRYDGEEQPIVPLVATIIREIERNKKFYSKLADNARGFLHKLRAVAYGFSAKSAVKVPGFAEIEASFVAKDMIDRSEAITADPLLDRSVYFDAFQQLSNVHIPSDARVVVLIDDLDRCLPDRAIRLLESIKLVLSQPGFIFFLGVARRVIEGYLQHRYKSDYGIPDFEGKDYLDKIIQLPFHIPPHRNRMPHFWKTVVQRLDVEGGSGFGELASMIEMASGSNPRSVIRFVNNLLVDRAIYRGIAGANALEDMPISFFAVSRIIQQRWPDMFALLTEFGELRREVASWETTGPVDGAPDSPITLEAVRQLQRHTDLAKLLKTDFGQRWLLDDKRRREAVEFLISERSHGKQRNPEVLANYSVFVVYGHKDAEAGAKVVDALRQEGLRVLDASQAPLQTSSVMGTASPSEDPVMSFIETAVCSCELVLLLIGSQFVIRELGVALLHKKPMFLVSLPSTKMTSIPAELRHLPHIQLDDINDVALNSLVETLRRKNVS